MCEEEVRQRSDRTFTGFSEPWWYLTADSVSQSSIYEIRVFLNVAFRIFCGERSWYEPYLPAEADAEFFISCIVLFAIASYYSIIVERNRWVWYAVAIAFNPALLIDLVQF